MNKLQRLELLKDFIQEAVNRGATSVEEIHQYIADLPFEAFEKAGLMKADTLGLRSLSRRSIGLVYGAVRRINHGIGQLISDQIENIEETQEVATLLREHAQKPAAGKTAAVVPPTKPVVTVVPTAKKKVAKVAAKKPKKAASRTSGNRAAKTSKPG
jgi:hypothetical protein